MKRLALAACVLLGACAFLQPSPQTSAPLRAGEVLSAHAAHGSVTVGKSTKADVRAVLGEAVVVDFESGYEVWVYRERNADKPPASRSELVLLFAPSGNLTRTRVR